MQSAAIKTSDVFQNGRSADFPLHVELSESPTPTTGILDAHGEPTIPSQSLMIRLDKKLKEPVTVSWGTFWTPTIIMAFAMLLFSYGGSIMGWWGKTQTQTTEIEGVKNTVNTVKEDVNHMRDDIREIRGLLIRYRQLAAAGAVQQNQPDPEKDKK